MVNKRGKIISDRPYIGGLPKAEYVIVERGSVVMKASENMTPVVNAAAYDVFADKNIIYSVIAVFAAIVREDKVFRRFPESYDAVRVLRKVGFYTVGYERSVFIRPVEVRNSLFCEHGAVGGY